jgi:ethanolamine utilization protein EutQ (cupin superfamily)
VHPGVFVSKASTATWEPDPDVPGSEMHELVHRDGIWAGLTRITGPEEPVPWTPEQREVAIILEGSVRIEVAGGDTLELEAGDLFSLPPGVETTWHVSTPFKEMWVLAAT